MPWWTFTNCSCLSQQSLCPLVIPPSAINMLVSSLALKESHNQAWLSLCSPHIWMPVFFHSAFSDMAFTHNTTRQGPLYNLQTPWLLLSLHVLTSSQWATVFISLTHSPLFLGIHTWPLILSRLCKSSFASSHVNSFFLPTARDEAARGGLLSTSSS